ncbi:MULTISPECIES: hypothetical protein [unclassified Bartonella]|uniref:hypothetical protein n=1 Tax=unclassified Bartonella TaxID=2645622 RepID=UPI0035D02F77
MDIAWGVFIEGVGVLLGWRITERGIWGGHWFLISNNGVFAGTVGLVPFFALALIFIYKGAKRRSVTGWMFWR